MDDLSLGEALSGTLGSISLVSWVLVLVPQLAENYRAKNAQSLSLAFLAVWFVGDLTNLIGAVWAQLVPTVIALAFYFCLADAVLILQCLYYNYFFGHIFYQSSSPQAEITEDPSRPLLARQDSNVGLPGSRHRSSAFQELWNTDGGETLVADNSENNGWAKRWARNVLIILCVCILGAVGWAIAWKTGLWVPIHEHHRNTDVRSPVGAEILGYVSAVCYLGARIPQIAKNYRNKSCEGLSLLSFVLSLLGNSTYGGGIIFHSTQRTYLLDNLPWLVGSLGTMGEDIVIFVQFYRYGDSNRIK
ncbi:MAG: hypothetical protein LQ339_007807 [Xanthoria mediterranea]|nr:MAG: hypothetical protein LQ339_007807 [Xanthoria mediterranea]